MLQTIAIPRDLFSWPYTNSPKFQNQNKKNMFVKLGRRVKHHKKVVVSAPYIYYICYSWTKCHQVDTRRLTDYSHSETIEFFMISDLADSTRSGSSKYKF